MPISVKIVDNVAVWLASSPVTLVEVRKAYSDTGALRERYHGSARLLLFWNAEVPAAIRAEITEMHERTATVFEHLILAGPATALASLTARVAMSRSAGPRLDVAHSLEEALALVSEGLPACTAGLLRTLFGELGASGVLSVRPSGTFRAPVDSQRK